MNRSSQKWFTINIMLNLVIPLFLITLIGCAGPTSPFGAVNSQIKYEIPSKENQDILFTMSPDRQVFHQASDIHLKIDEPSGVTSGSELRVFYNGYDLTPKLIRHSKLIKTSDKIELTLKKIRIPAGKKNKIHFLYKRDEFSKPKWTAYKPPLCDFTDTRWVQDTSPFEVDDHILRTIQKVAVEEKINPALITGLVAQESSFNPRSVSIKRAIGLSQMTGIAEKEIEPEITSWPQYPHINSMSAQTIRSLIKQTIINPNNEWRLNPELSVRGGIRYLKKVMVFWNKKDQQKLLKSLTGDYKQTYTNAVIASYNAGSTRVRRAIAEYGSDWIHKTQMREPKTYVPLIMSYCYHFSNSSQEVTDAR